MCHISVLYPYNSAHNSALEYWICWYNFRPMLTGNPPRLWAQSVSLFFYNPLPLRFPWTYCLTCTICSSLCNWRQQGNNLLLCCDKVGMESEYSTASCLLWRSLRKIPVFVICLEFYVVFFPAFCKKKIYGFLNTCHELLRKFCILHQYHRKTSF